MLGGNRLQFQPSFFLFRRPCRQMLSHFHFYEHMLNTSYMLGVYFMKDVLGEVTLTTCGMKIWIVLDAFVFPSCILVSIVVVDYSAEEPKIINSRYVLRELNVRMKFDIVPSSGVVVFNRIWYMVTFKMNPHTRSCLSPKVQKSFSMKS